MPGKDPGPSVKDPEQYEAPARPGRQQGGRSGMSKDELIDALRNH